MPEIARNGTLLLLDFSVALAASCSSPRQSAVETPDAAIAAAKTGWAGIYDKTQRVQYSPSETKKFEPYTATLNNGRWTVKGTVPHGYRGDTLVTTVRASDGSVTVIVLAID
jgi:NTF2 fold immunity protein of polymorphic toxin system component